MLFFSATSRIFDTRDVDETSLRVVKVVKVEALAVTLYSGAQVNFHPYFALLLSDLDEKRLNRSALNAVEHLRFS